MAKRKTKKSSLNNDSSPIADGLPTEHAKEQTNIYNTDNSSAVPHKELSEHDIFTGDNDFYSLLTSTQPASEAQKNQKDKPAGNLASHLSFTIFQKILIIGIFVTTSILLYAVIILIGSFRNGPVTASGSQMETTVNQQPAATPEPIIAENTDENSLQTIQPETTTVSAQPLSLEFARRLYLQNNFNDAYSVYSRLYQSLTESEELYKDYIRLQMAFCEENQNRYEEAGKLFVIAAESRSPIIRIVANARLCNIEIQRKRYLNARTRAYKSLALIKAVDINNDWALAFECDCYFLAARCLTSHIMALANVETALPEDLWGRPSATVNPFMDLNDTELDYLLNCGVENLQKGLLAPEIRDIQDNGALPRFSIISYQSPIEQVLSQFTTSAKYDLNWPLDRTGTSELFSDREVPVSLYLPSTSAQDIIMIAAGSTGFLAELEQEDENTAAYIYNPADYSSLKDHLILLSRHNISLWRRFIFTFNSDERLGNTHFIMGLLYTLTGQAPEAISEYKQVANRFSRGSIAPYALLQSSKLKSELSDYAGAREDLRQLIDQYPDTPVFGQAYLNLAEVTEKSGSYNEAAQLYSRLYNYELSDDLKISSALGAAKCYYFAKTYSQADIWFRRHINLGVESQKTDLYSAYYLLGKTSLEMGDTEQANVAFQYAMMEQNSREQYIEALKELVQSCIIQEKFVDALSLLDNARSVALSEEQSLDILLLKSTIYRMMGITDLAVDLLNNRLEYITEKQFKVRILFETAKCCLADEKLESAQKHLSQALYLAEPGPLAQQIAVELANLCLNLGEYAQAISIGLDVLNTDSTEDSKQQILEILSSAYTQQKQYDKAALAQMGYWK